MWLNRKERKKLEKKNKVSILENKKNHVEEVDSKNVDLKNKKENLSLRVRKLKYRNRINLSDVFLSTFFYSFLNVYKHKVDIRLAPNNIFGTCALILGSKVLKSVSAGVFKLKSSRKMKKHTFPKFISKFKRILHKSLRNQVNRKGKKFYYKSTIVTLTLNKIFRSKIKKTFDFIHKEGQKTNKILYIIRPKVCFNGCRVSKKRRKKRIRFRVFK
jgi:hypothetical protein